MADWLPFEEGGRRFRVSGIDGLRSDVAKAASEVERLPTDPDRAAGSGALSWADPHERMWTITKLFEQTHTDPTLWNTKHLKRSFDDFGWLSEAARPR